MGAEPIEFFTMSQTALEIIAVNLDGVSLEDNYPWEKISKPDKDGIVEIALRSEGGIAVKCFCPEYHLKPGHRRSRNKRAKYSTK
jgi:hypothetical protein